MRTLSKSKIMAYRQCPTRLWLEVMQPENREDSDYSQAGFIKGSDIGAIARQLYDPEHQGRLVNIETMGFNKAFAATQAWLKDSQPIFEAAFNAAGGLALADVMLPEKNKPNTWNMIEVKSATSVKEHYIDDAAIQVYVAQQSGVQLNAISIALINSQWVYPSNQNYQGLMNSVKMN